MASTLLLYLLTFPNGKRYIGITSKTLRRRMIVHFSHARTGRKGALQNAIRKYGAGTVTATVLVMCEDWSYLCALEQRAIAALNTLSPHGYNQTLGGEGLLGVRLSEDARRRQAASITGKKLGNQFARGYRHTLEAREKISEAGRKRVLSQAGRAKISASKVGNKFSLGRRYTQEQKDQIAASVRAALAKKRAENGIHTFA